MNLRRFIGKCRAGWYIIRSKIHPSFSQAGEDQVIKFLFYQLKIMEPTYLDIGANHPVIGNNTYYFYSRGHNGVCVEPDPYYTDILKKHRSRDTILNIGITHDNRTEGNLFIFPHPYSGWNTFSEGDAELRQKESGVQVKKAITIQMKNINEVLKDNFEKCPNLISIDVEGMDLQILKTVDFEKYKPEVICVETITFSTNNEESDIPEIEIFLRSKGYFSYANTHINTIFCRTDVYN